MKEVKAFVQPQLRCTSGQSLFLGACLLSGDSQVEVVVILAGVDLLKSVENFLVDPFGGPLNELAQLR